MAKFYERKRSELQRRVLAKLDDTSQQNKKNLLEKGLILLAGIPKQVRAHMNEISWSQGVGVDPKYLEGRKLIRLPDFDFSGSSPATTRTAGRGYVKRFMWILLLTFLVFLSIHNTTERKTKPLELDQNWKQPPGPTEWETEYVDPAPGSTEWEMEYRQQAQEETEKGRLAWSETMMTYIRDEKNPENKEHNYMLAMQTVELRGGRVCDRHRGKCWTISLPKPEKMKAYEEWVKENNPDEFTLKHNKEKAKKYYNILQPFLLRNLGLDK
jgi:hypothetical protein